MGFAAAERATALGVTPETISRWETGRHPIDPAALGLLTVLVREAAAGSTSTLDMLRARRAGVPLAPRVALELAS
jgi:transcriptional regulator with XRE-family HTH domain